MYNDVLVLSVIDSGCGIRRVLAVESARLNRPLTIVDILPTSSLTFLLRSRVDSESNLLSEKKVKLLRPPVEVSYDRLR